MTLDDLKTGERARVIKVAAHGPFKKRLLEMGFISGTDVEVIKYAPLKDPVEYLIRGYHISLRHEEAKNILVEKT
ncbi:MAG: FeoA family protein [Desulfobacteraceae bacterium]|nr:FeoA family protein [Desulfobacteraceae bacterium]